MRFPAGLGMAGLCLVLVQCSQVSPLEGYGDQSVPIWGAHAAATPVSVSGGAEGLLRQVNLKVDMVPRGSHGRKVVRRMNPRYITIHSTQNWSADAERHALALKRGALRAPKRRGGNRTGYLIWHFTVDDDSVVQHMPTTEQGEHADFDGPGNNYSIGIEMCENRDGSLGVTVDRTAKLTAFLMDKHGIPLSRVVPHYHWPRRGVSQPHKNCPHFLLDNGRPGRKWRGFLDRVNQYHQAIRASEVVSR